MNLTNSVSVAEAKSHLSEIISRVEAGEEVVITRRGVDVVRLVPVVPRNVAKTDWKALRALRESMPMATTGAAELIRQMRDDERY